MKTGGREETATRKGYKKLKIILLLHALNILAQ